MKTKHRGHGRLIIEEFTVSELKEYLTSVIKYTDDMRVLVKMADGAQEGKTKFLDESGTFKIETLDRG